MIHVGVDLHQRFCYCTSMKASGEVIAQRSVANEAQSLRHVLRSLPGPRQVVVEACGFLPGVPPGGEGADGDGASAAGQGDRVGQAEERQGGLGDIAQLSRCDLLPEAWMADEDAERQRVRLRVTLGRQRTCCKNLLHALLHQEGVKVPVSDLFGKRGQAWLQQVALSETAAESVASYLEVISVLDRLIVDKEKQMQDRGKQDARVRWLQTIPGVGAYLATLIVAELGDVHRFRNPKR